MGTFLFLFLGGGFTPHALADFVVCEPRVNEPLVEPSWQ
jgi:hypothetical protein